MSPCAPAPPATPRKMAGTESMTLPKRVFMAAKPLSMTCLSKSRRRVDPQHPGFRAAGILPAVRNRAFKIQTVAGFQPVMLALIQPDFQISAKDMQKLLPLMRVRFAAAPAGLHAK